MEQKARDLLERHGNLSTNEQIETPRSPSDLIAELGVISPLLRAFVAPNDSLTDFECFPPGLRPDLEASIVPGDSAKTLAAVRNILENS